MRTTPEPAAPGRIATGILHGIDVLIHRKWRQRNRPGEIQKTGSIKWFPDHNIHD